MLCIVKAASLVEYNAVDYTTYLNNVFSDDTDFHKDIQIWSSEETQHGESLGAWARRADPLFDFDGAFARYKAGYHINVNAQASVRGSKTGEMIARCIVETGTSSYYTSLSAATEEPVLKKLCQNIAADELRHYQLFYKYLHKYLAQEDLGRWEQFKIALGRIQESEDDELAFAYFSANALPDAVYDKGANTSAFMARAFPLYRPDTIERMIAMFFRACGIKLPTIPRKIATHAAQQVMSFKVKRALVAQG
jgi:hypothetical protein